MSDAVTALRLQQPTPQEDEMDDVRWFNRYADHSVAWQLRMHMQSYMLYSRHAPHAYMC